MAIQLSQIVTGAILPESFTQGDDIHVSLLTCQSYQASIATRQLLDIFTARSNDGKPHASYQTRMVELGLWHTVTQKNGKVVPVGVVKRKAELLQVYGRASIDTIAEYRVLCTFDAIRVMQQRDKDENKEMEKQAAALLPIEPTVEGKEAEAIVKPLALSEDKGAVKVSSALGRLNKLVAMFDGDEQYALLIDELKCVIQELAA